MTDELDHLRVAIVHDWLVDKGGAERVLHAMLECFPRADVFSVVDFMRSPDRDFLGGRTVRTSFVQKLPFARRHYRAYLPMMPLAIESLDVTGYDLVLSSSYAVAKGVLTSPDQLHVSYVHSPMRYAWDLQHQYLREAKLEHGAAGWLARWMLHRMRMWDVRTADGVDSFLTNSRFIARRVWKTYRRQSSVLYPPVDTDFFCPSDEPREEFYVTASRLVPYKRIGLIVDAFGELPERKLVVIGDGPGLDALRSRAPRNVSFLGYQSAEVLREYLRRARAFVFAALEDFGIAPVEAQACGTPVLAYGAGGAKETVVDGRTGLLFAEQSIAAIRDVIERFERSTIPANVAGIRANALRFGLERFRRQLSAHVRDELRRRASGVHEAVLAPESGVALERVADAGRSVGGV